MNPENLSIVIERDSIDYSKKYRFNPTQDGRCQTTRKGKIVLHRRLAKLVLGINFPKTNLRIVEKYEKDGCFYGLIIQPVIESQDDRIITYRYKHSAIVVLSILFYKLNLNYKKFQYSFISEPLTLGNGYLAIQLMLEDIRPWPEAKVTPKRPYRERLKKPCLSII